MKTIQKANDKITIFELLAKNNPEASSALLKKYGITPKSKADIELKLVNLYQNADDKIAFEKQLCEIHPHKKLIERYVQPKIVEKIVEKKVEVPVQQTLTTPEPTFDKTKEYAQAVAEQNKMSSFDATTNQATTNTSSIDKLMVFGGVMMLGILSLTIISIKVKK